jgi:hypothetical protein
MYVHTVHRFKYRNQVHHLYLQTVFGKYCVCKLIIWKREDGIIEDGEWRGRVVCVRVCVC